MPRSQRHGCGTKTIVIFPSMLIIGFSQLVMPVFLQIGQSGGMGGSYFHSGPTNKLTH
jgi:hypothetical protein